jgi:hypothetical protein
MTQIVATAISRPVSVRQLASIPSREAVPVEQPISTAAGNGAGLLKQFVAVLLRSLSCWAA